MAVKKDKSLGIQIDMMILAALDREPSHGYALIQQLRDTSEGLFDFPEGTIYPILHSLEVKGFIESAWSEPTSGRKRKLYALTHEGRAELAGRRALWTRLSGALDRILFHPSSKAKKS